MSEVTSPQAWRERREGEGQLERRELDLASPSSERTRDSLHELGLVLRIQPSWEQQIHPR